MIKEVNSKNSGVYILKNCSIKESSRGTKYMITTIVEGSDHISGNVWNITEDIKDLKTGAIVYAEWTATEYNGAPQAKYSVFRPATEAEIGSIKNALPDTVKSAVPAENMYQEIMKIIDSLDDEDYKKLCKNIYTTYKDKIIELPAGKTVHHDYLGGLMEHQLEMAKTAIAITPIYKCVANMTAVVTGCLLHDIAKMYEFSLGDVGIVSAYSIDGILFGHLYMGAKLVSEAAVKLNIPAEKTRILEHMIVSHHGLPENGAITHPATAEAMLLSQIDEMSAHMNIFKKEYADIQPGNLAEKKNYFLDATVYRPAWSDSTPVATAASATPTAAPNPVVPNSVPTAAPLQQYNDLATAVMGGYADQPAVPAPSSATAPQPQQYNDLATAVMGGYVAQPSAPAPNPPTYTPPKTVPPVYNAAPAPQVVPEVPAMEVPTNEPSTDDGDLASFLESSPDFDTENIF